MKGQRIGRGKLNLRRMCDTERSLSSEKLQVQTQKISFCQLWWDYKLLLKRNDINAITIFLPSCVVVRKTAIFEDTQLKQSGPVSQPTERDHYLSAWAIRTISSKPDKNI